MDGQSPLSLHFKVFHTCQSGPMKCAACHTLRKGSTYVTASSIPYINLTTSMPYFFSFFFKMKKKGYSTPLLTIAKNFGCLLLKHPDEELKSCNDNHLVNICLPPYSYTEKYHWHCVLAVIVKEPMVVNSPNQKSPHWKILLYSTH